MRFHSYFNTTLKIVELYNGSVPLAHYLKQYFAQHKKHGSKDRKLISHLCYCYYRAATSLKGLPVEEQLKISLFLCTDQPGEWQILYDEQWLKEWSSQLQNRIGFIQVNHPHFTVDQLFPFKASLSQNIDATAFALSHLIQPDVFIRIRPGKKNIVQQKLEAHAIAYAEVKVDCLALPNTTKVDAVIELNNEAVVQDYSSQRVSEFLAIIQQKVESENTALTTWDCCAASGGKAILAVDTLKNISLTVSDIRPSILHNLQARFKQAGIHNYQSFVADLTKKDSSGFQSSAFDFIICDAPCTGSGTWSRTPEQLYFFDEKKIDEYVQLQQKIVTTAIAHLNKNGYFLYITCSVFEKENEAMVDFITANFQLSLLHMETLKGYSLKADSMFAALFQR